MLSQYTRGIELNSLTLTWSRHRLGSFLFQRIQKDGKDSRFDTLKPYFFRFFNVWSIQGLWVFLTALPVYTLNSSEDTRPLTFVDLLGLCLWVFGFALEVTADRQKSEWRDNPVNKGRFITVGLWGLSRHPNYFGESTLWLGMFIVSTPILHGWQWICAISPIFVVLLLTKVSGVPLLEKKADEKWGDEEEYQKYKRETPIFIPKLPSM
ncbi:hypothetical protein SARC_14950 [Sphaeroforma arctica JP610]|uniref:Uncharacterized protein n=1 Tax=Sphaeroforma arctica JP610 TaxID=667725 RepID=A0A0L0F8P3_9EUKA|nr:hypothetical protein SARC_14950 [Sphaeroforma arctica JP610]KNC72493.1 hypothetical protein SARC_14950 [Sphaeroforma arctica JP610]|eukprot:XP_014146395.1 hypothetical protein SARC_14950 [Sphaeroforma arctica JP610]